MPSAVQASRTPLDLHFQPSRTNLKVQRDLKKIVKTQAPLSELDQVLDRHDLYTLYPEFYSSKRETVETAKQLVDEAIFFLENTPHAHSSSWKDSFMKALYALQAVLESVLSVFGIADCFKPAENTFDESMKFHKISALLALITLLTSTILPLLGVQAGLPIVGGIFLGIAVLSIIYPKISPLPLSLPEGENWSKKARFRQLEVASGRDKEVDDIAQKLIAGNTHPMLVGPSGIGKTDTVKAFVNAVESGKYPQLKGKRVFYFNTANLVSMQSMSQGDGKVLRRISEKIGRHTDDVILIFDEIHTACQGGSNVGEQLKTLLDRKFKHVVGLTTDTEYAAHIATNRAFSRRFSRIDVRSMRKKDTEVALRQFLLHNAPQLMLDPSGSKRLIELTSTKPQPFSAVEALAKCVNEAAQMQPTDKELELAKLNRRFRTKFSASATSPSSVAMRREVESARRRKQRVEKAVAQEKANIEKLLSARNQLLNAKIVLYRTINKIKKMDHKNLSSVDRKKLTKFLILHHFLIPALDRRVTSLGTKVKVTTHINRKFVNCVVST